MRVKGVTVKSPQQKATRRLSIAMNSVTQDMKFRQSLMNYGYFSFRVDVNNHFTINKILLLQNIPLEFIHK